MSSGLGSGIEDGETVFRPKVARPSAGKVGFALRIIGGPDAGRSLVIPPTQPSRVLVGQSASCDLRLTDREASRRHLGVEIADAELRITDLGSTNGTRINGVSIIEALVRGGERIEIGRTLIDVERKVQAADESLSTATGFGRVVGESPAMRKLYPLCARLAATIVPVIIEGETGTGKEVLAESLHEMGPRASGPFAVFDCTAVPPNLVESALFGHERGAFTGATDARKGVFEEAHGGTLLIDEIGDLEIELQAKLLRALERSEIRRIGGKQWQRVDVRVLAATRRNLDQEVSAGRFRDDLFYRLAVARIELPPLRRRAGDIALLARFFWGRMAGPKEPVPEDFIARLEDYAWPGNVRELHNAVARRVALGDLADHRVGLATPDALTPNSSSRGDDAIGRVIAQGLSLPRAREKLIEEFEQRYVEHVLDQHGGNVARAAAASGIARRYFQLIRARTRKQEAGG
ncbi:MAG: sigma 54-dependent Fis family transcriptional regulator [Polyangiaceae bacterium]|nr:sigma 54-dependent Fis family transcriptional regulator [Polyangiaceae bacterium]